MIGLNRQLAPISERAWKHLEREAREVLELHFAARRLVEFEGPLGWAHSAIDSGRLEPIASPFRDVWVRRRVVFPLVELRLHFRVERAELDRIDRGASTVELDELREAARLFAAAEDTLMFEGSAEAGIPGLVRDSEHRPVALSPDPLRLPEAITFAIEQLRRAGVRGPYVAALGPAAHAALNSATGGGGYPVVRHVERLLDRPAIWAPTLPGGFVASVRGGDFKLICGRDAAIGYERHDEKSVTLFLEESFGAELSGPDAIVPLLPAPAS
ncbi:MAG TPA: family 1 encapsulin nanocompartment shell protein [Myxococcota bacterium]|nr:family 1 encapsulin nanocompartment shell protein [Myxococcota bacterium]